MEPLCAQAEARGNSGPFRLWSWEEGLVGFAIVPARSRLKEETEHLYRVMLESSRGLSLYRVWNVVPDINLQGSEGLENYRSFCVGRSLAFEGALGEGFAARLPAASAVGGSDGNLAVAFVAGSAPCRHFENPLQVPAYLYPSEHGPRSPSFSRATVVEGKAGRRIYISGTSSIIGHATEAPHDTGRQVEVTLVNLEKISLACGLGEDLGGASCLRRFRVYLRSEADREAAAASLQGRFLADGDCATYLKADICRSALNVEIEVAVEPR